jgi:C1A family cysteine protease
MFKTYYIYYDNSLNNIIIIIYTMMSSVMKFLCVIGAVCANIESRSNVYKWTNYELEFHPEWSTFNNFMISHHKNYSHTDVRDKFKNFVINLQIVRSHHNDNYDLGMNKYGDLSAEEFKSHINAGCYKDTSVDNYSPCDDYTTRDVSPMKSLDWRSFGVVTPVKNQGKCGSCWSFSATGAMESAWMLHTGEDITLSEQQLIDCSTAYGDNGCNGGMMPDAFGYAIDYGMCTEEEDVYEATDGNCTYCLPHAHFDSCKLVQPNNELALQNALHNGPVSVAIEADQKAFQFYTGGIIDTPSCGTNLDHGVLVVGYGTDNGKDYWTIKNSWGPDWGEDGYVRIAKTNRTDYSGMCGVAMQPSFPVVKDDSRVRICYCA